MLTDMQVVLVQILTVLIMIALIDSSKVIPLSAESDEENTLRQALYLVKLLKADYMKSLRENDELETNFVDDEANSTCPDDDFNTTTTMLYSVPVSASPIMTTPKPVMLVAHSKFINPPSHGFVATAESVLHAHRAPPVAEITAREQIKNNPAPNTQTRPAEYTAPGESYNYPYSFYPRRMMPSYDYYDDPMPRFGGYKRVGNQNAKGTEPLTNVGNYRRFEHMPPPLYPYDYPMSGFGGYRRVGDKNPNNTELLSEDFGQYKRFGYVHRPLSRGKDKVFLKKEGGVRFTKPVFQSHLYRRIGDSGPEISETVGAETTGADTTTVSKTLLTGVSDGGPKIAKTIGPGITVPNITQSLSTEMSERTTAMSSVVQATLSTVSKRMATIPKSQSSLKILNRSTDRRNNVNTSQALGKALKADIKKDIQKFKKNNTARQRTTRDKVTNEDQVLSEIASELINEIKLTKTEKTTQILRQGIGYDTLSDNGRPVSYKTTMRIFLKGSSRLHVPFSENNAFCHMYPHNRLCSSGM